MTASIAGIRRQDNAVVVVLAGDWHLENDVPRFGPLMESAPSPGNSASVVAFDASELGEWDSSLLIFVRQAHEYSEAHKLEFDPTGLPDRITRLLDLALARIVSARQLAILGAHDVDP